MGIGSLAGIAGHCLESLFASSASNGSTATATPGNTASALSATSQNSPFAQILDHVQGLAHPRHHGVTQQISGEFSTASVNWQLPNINSLAQATGY